MGTIRRRHNCCNILQSHQKCQFPKSACAHHEITYIHVGVEMEWHWDGVNCSTSKLLDTIVEEATRDAQACETLLKILSVGKERLCELVIQQATMKTDLETKHFCWSNNCSSRDSYIPLLQTIGATSAHHHTLEEEKW